MYGVGIVQWSNMISESDLNYCSSVKSILKTHKGFEDDSERLELKTGER